MLWLRVLEPVFALLAIAFIVWQIILPAAQGRKLFPMFRPSQKIRDTLVKAHEKSHEQELLARFDQIEGMLPTERETYYDAEIQRAYEWSNHSGELEVLLQRIYEQRRSEVYSFLNGIPFNPLPSPVDEAKARATTQERTPN